MQVVPLTRHLGAEIRGLDLSRPLGDADFHRLRDAFHAHSVIVLRDQVINEHQHIAVSRRFGSLEVHVAKQYLLPSHPEIVVLSNRKRPDGSAEGIEDAGRYWHSDLSYMPRPSLGSLLYAHEVPPPEEGGDTLFASMYAAYGALDDAMRQRLDGMQAVHSYWRRWRRDAEEGRDRREPSVEEKRAIPEVAHPVVRLHPGSGRKALYVNEGFTCGIVGWSEDQSRALLKELFEISTRPAFVYRHRWCRHDLVFWDNRCVIHAATWYNQNFTRHMHRTTVAGDGTPT